VLAALVPIDVVTKTLAVPTVPAGVVAVTVVEFTPITLVAATPPIVTPVAPVKLAPVIVTLVPPNAVPVDGDIDDTVGGDEPVYSNAPMVGVDADLAVPL